MKREKLEEFIAQFPIYQYTFLNPSQIEFSDAIRTICKQECQRYNTTWACPPAVGTVAECKAKCLSYQQCFFFSTIAEVSDVMNLEEVLITRGEHEEMIQQIEEFLRTQNTEFYTLSTESCAICETCSYPDSPCRFPLQMHPCVESHGIVVTNLAEAFSMDYTLSCNQILWFGIIFIKDSYSNQ